MTECNCISLLYKGLDEVRFNLPEHYNPWLGDILDNIEKMIMNAERFQKEETE